MSLILKLDHFNGVQESKQDLKIDKIISSISPSNFIKLLKDAENQVNPRNATVNRITKSIFETLDSSPELFWFKSKGILLATESCEVLDRGRIKVTLENKEYEGIMDGGHNTFAIAYFIINKLFGDKVKNWDDCKEFWNKNFDEIISKFNANESQFNFSIPIEIIFPNGEDGSNLVFYDHISEICAARNNNVQLPETSKGNHVGYYDYLKETLNGTFDVIWKAGDSGKVKSEDIISFATLPLLFLKQQGKLPNDIRGLNKISLYSQKSKCVEFYNEVIAHNLISKEVNGKFVLTDKTVESALDLTKDILFFFDRMFLEFGDLYNRTARGRFGGISAVIKKKTKAPFGTIDVISEYYYPFGFFYPLIAGLTNLMEIDKDKNIVRWRVNPEFIDMDSLDLIQYVELIRMVSFDPQKIGKGAAFYNQSELIFEKVR